MHWQELESVDHPSTLTTASENFYNMSQALQTANLCHLGADLQLIVEHDFDNRSRKRSTKPTSNIIGVHLPHSISSHLLVAVRSVDRKCRLLKTEVLCRI